MKPLWKVTYTADTYTFIIHIHIGMTHTHTSYTYHTCPCTYRVEEGEEGGDKPHVTTDSFRSVLQELKREQLYQAQRMIGGILALDLFSN